MSTYANTNDGTDYDLSPSALLARLDGLAGVDVSECDAQCCGALGCTRTDSPLWRVDVDGGQRRTLCPAHAVYFTRKESGRDV